MSGNFSESLALVVPRLSRTLISESQLRSLLQLAEDLPPLHRGGFEYQLGKGPGLDLQQAVESTAAEHVKFHRFSRQSSGRYAAGLARLGSLFSMWPSTQAGASTWLKRVWLEFDETRGEVSTPSIFLSLREQVQPEALVRHAEHLFNVMADVTLDQVARQYLLRACRPGMDFSQISDLGCMASRECQTMRLILPCRSSRGVLACLEAFEWSGDLSATQDWCSRLFRVVKELRVCIDVSDKILPTVGLEIAINADSGDDPTALALGEMFVQNKFCRPRELAALLQWPGIITPQDAQGSWPQALVVASIEGQANALTALQCRFSHFKVTLGVNVEPVVKAYFGYFETWLGTSIVQERAADGFFARG